MPGKDQPVWLECLKHAPPKALVKFREFAESATHAQRVEAMVGVGRLVLEQKTEAIFVVSELRKGDFAERFLAINSCHGSRDGEHLLHATNDRSETIRAMARALLTIYGTDDQIVEAFEKSARVTRKSLLRRLSKRKRFAPVDRILVKLEQNDVQEFAALLPYASADFVKAHWQRIEDNCSAVEWERLTRNKRDFSNERILEVLNQTPDFEPRLFRIANSVLALLAKNRAKGTMNVIEAMLRIGSLSQVRLYEAVRSFPVEVASVCASHEDEAVVNFFYAFDKLDDQLLIKIMKRYPPDYGIAKVLKKLPVVSRRMLYEHVAVAWRSENDGVLDDGIIETMPVDIREREGRLHLSMDSLLTNPQLRLMYAAFLPFSEVKTELAATITDPDAELRGVAWRTLIASLRFNRGELAYVLDEIKKRKKEQDPVRQEIAQALSELPPVIWKAEHLSDLAVVIADALEARDLSHTTAYYLEMLVLILVPFHTEWAAKSLALIWRERGQAAVSGFQFRISDEEAKKIEGEIIPVLKHWNKKEYENIAIRAAGLFGQRLKVTTQIVALLKDIVLNCSDAAISEQALHVIGSYAYGNLKEIVPLMLKKDSSWGTVPVVLEYLFRYRQDLLTPYLGQQIHKGRYNAGKLRVVPSLQKGIARLSSKQLKIYAESINSMASDKENRRLENVFVINHLACIPNCPIEYLSRLASSTNSRAYERTLAVAALSRLDEGQGIPLLVESLEDPQLAYVAIYALRTCLLKMPGDEAFQIILKAPRKQISVFKEVVRLLGDIRHEEALKELYSIMYRDLHRDVRVATLCALWSHLDKKESWKFLQDAVNDENDAVASTAIRTPGDRLSKEGQKQLVSLLVKGLQHTAMRVRMKTLERLGEMPVADPEMYLLDATIQALNSESPEEFANAARALVRLYAHTALNAFPKAASSIMSKRRNIIKFVDHMEYALAESRSKMIPATYATIAALESDPLTLTLRARLAIASMPWNELAQWFKEHDEKGMLHADVISEAGSRIIDSQRSDIEEIVEMESELASSESEVLRRIALYALAAQSGISRGWDEERLQRLEAFRNDPSPYIAEVAQFTLPAEEEALKAAQKS